MSRTSSLTIRIALALILLAAPASAVAADLVVSGWIPYWRTNQGVSEALKNRRMLDEINPFAYSVTASGTLVDTARLGSADWSRLFRTAASSDIPVIPTIMWSDAAAMDRILNDPTLRTAHVREIVNTVSRGGFEGIDIDYEGKRASTRVGFSAFLTELGAALKREDTDLTLNCTIEARMPLSARFAGTPPANIEYANDLPTIGRVCDTVRIMTYDQQTADVELQRTHLSRPYAPIADVTWVRKVVEYMDDDIDRDKISIGIATYGHSYQLMSNSSGSGFQYTRLGALIPDQALATAKQYRIKPVRNPSGELAFSYVPSDTHPDLPSQSELAALAPRGTAPADAAWKGALEYSKRTGRQAPVTFVTWSDAGAIADKVALAKRLGVRGVAIFSVSGIAESRAWRAFR